MVKTITITDEAYNLVKSNKREGESFSNLFLRSYDKKVTARELAGTIKHPTKSIRELIMDLEKQREEMNKNFLGGA